MEASRESPLNDVVTSSLLQQHLAGDKNAIDRLFAIHHQRLRQMVRARLHPNVRTRVDESDILQETMIAASKMMSDYATEPRIPFFIWLRWLTSQQIQLCHRNHLDAKKRDVRRDQHIYPDVQNSLSEIIAEHFSLSTPSKIVSRQELVATVLQVLEKMKPTDREILCMRHFEEMTNPEVAISLDISESNASTRYVRALARLQKALSAIPGFVDGE